VHEFDRHGKALAFILGSWSEQEYRLWGAYDVELENRVGYHKLVHLEEVTPDDAEGVDVAKDSPVTEEALSLIHIRKQQADKRSHFDKRQLPQRHQYACAQSYTVRSSPFSCGYSSEQHLLAF